MRTLNVAVVQGLTPVAFLSRLTPRIVNHHLEESQAGIQRLLLSILESGGIKHDRIKRRDGRRAVDIIMRIEVQGNVKIKNYR